MDVWRWEQAPARRYVHTSIRPYIHSRCSGFTLLELMVALSVMSIAIIALLRVVITNINAVGDARDRTIAASLAEAKLHDIARDPEAQTSENSGNFGTAHPNFSWTSATTETQWPQLKRVAVSIVWLRGRTQKQINVETLIRVQEETSAAEDTGATPGAGAPGGGPGAISSPAGGGRGP